MEVQCQYSPTDSAALRQRSSSLHNARRFGRGQRQDVDHSSYMSSFFAPHELRVSANMSRAPRSECAATRSRSTSLDARGSRVQQFRYTASMLQFEFADNHKCVIYCERILNGRTCFLSTNILGSESCVTAYICAHQFKRFERARYR